MKGAPREIPQLPTNTQQKILTAVNEVYFQPQPDNDDFTFASRYLVQATLPHSDVKGNPPIWTRTNGHYGLILKPGYKRDPKTGGYPCIGYPYGTVPRLLLFWVTTEAVRTKQRRLELGHTLAAFMIDIGMNPDNGTGVRSDARRLREQMDRLFRATISFDYTGEGMTRWLDMQIAPKGQTWWDIQQVDQAVLFGSWIELGEMFFQAITEHPVPLDMRVIKALKKSPLALDLYTWLAYRTFTLKGKPVTISWAQINLQLGSHYTKLYDFVKYAKYALKKVLAIYPRLRVDVVRGGLCLRPSTPLIAPRAPGINLSSINTPKKAARTNKRT